MLPAQKALSAQPSSHLEEQKGAMGLEHMSPGRRQKVRIKKQAWTPECLEGCGNESGFQHQQVEKAQKQR